MHKEGDEITLNGSRYIVKRVKRIPSNKNGRVGLQCLRVSGKKRRWFLIFYDGRGRYSKPIRLSFLGTPPL